MEWYKYRQSEDLRRKANLRGHKIYFILLQYGGSLQIADTNGIRNIPPEELPVLRDGTIVTHLGDYTNDLLDSFRLNMNYSKTITKAGGHPGIGNISNVVGVNGDIKWVDLFKNKIINDLSGIRWSIDMKWDVYKEPVDREKKINEKVLMIDQIRKL